MTTTTSTTVFAVLLGALCSVLVCHGQPLMNQMRTYSIATGGNTFRPGFQGDNSPLEFEKRAFDETDELLQEEPEKRSAALGRAMFRPGKRSIAMGRSGFRPGKRSIATGRAGFRPGKRSVPVLVPLEESRLLALAQVLQEELAHTQDQV